MATSTPPFYKDKKFYPERDEFMKALQEEPQQDPKSEHVVYRYPKITKVAAKVFRKMKEGNFPNLSPSSNSSRISHDMMTYIVNLRKKFSKAELHTDFHSYADAEDRVYILQNDSEYFGFDVFLNNYSNHLGSKVAQKQEERTPSDAIRVAAVMLRRDNRAAVAGILSGVKDRAKSDQSIDPALAWAMDAVSQFKDENFVVPTPDDMDPNDVEGIDPNDLSRILLPRDAKWFLQTWRDYLKKKYKVAGKRWDTETGGGSHEAHEFSNYCDSNCRWLVWVYLMDLESDFLLLSNALCQPPVFVGRESGFESNVVISSVSGDDDAVDVDGGGGSSYRHSSGVRRKKKKNGPSDEDLKAEFVKKSRATATILDTLSTELKQRNEELERRREECNRMCEERNSMRVEFGDSKEETIIFETFLAANRKKKELEDACSCLTPRTRKMMLKKVNKKIKALGEEFKKRQHPSLSDDDDDDDDD